MIIALFGPPGAGKDTVGKILVEQYAYRRVAFADKVRELTLRLHPKRVIKLADGWTSPLEAAVKQHGWEYVKRESMQARELLEQVADGCREVIWLDVWINAAFGPHLLDNEDIVITDLRKRNEVDWILNWSASFGYEVGVWHITRNGCIKRPFDEWQPEWATATIENNGTVEELVAKVRELMNGFTSPPASPSQR